MRIYECRACGATLTHDAMYKHAMFDCQKRPGSTVKKGSTNG